MKLSSEPDDQYASSTGNKATIGTPVDYRWLFRNNSTKAITNLEVIDVLPYAGDKTITPNADGEYTDRGSTFKTPLISVEDNEKFTFYYSTDDVKDTVEENAAANWNETVPDMSKVTMIKAVLKSGQKIASGESTYIVTHNIIENNNKIGDGDQAYNSFAISQNNGTSWNEGLEAEVTVNYIKRDVKIRKVDLSDTDKTLEGAVFSLYEEGTGEDGTDRLAAEDITTGSNGIASIPDLTVGKEYYLLETAAPEGYAKSDEKIRFTVLSTDEEADQTITVANDVPRTSFDITKTWAGTTGDADVSEILVHILANGNDTGKTVTITKADDWKGTVGELPKFDENGNKIQYTITEEPVKGYTSSITGNMENGFVITNTKEEVPQEPETDDPHPDDPETDSPKTDSPKTDSPESDGSDKPIGPIIDGSQKDPVTDDSKGTEPVPGTTKTIAATAPETATTTASKGTTAATGTTAPAESTVKSVAPQTGYRSPIGLYIGILAAAALAIVLILSKKHKQDKAK